MLSRRNASDNIGERQLRLARRRAGHPPASLERPVEALLAVEVVGDQLLVDPGPGSDRADPRARETMFAELDNAASRMRSRVRSGSRLRSEPRGDRRGWVTLSTLTKSLSLHNLVIHLFDKCHAIA